MVKILLGAAALLLRPGSAFLPQRASAHYHSGGGRILMQLQSPQQRRLLASVTGPIYDDDDDEGNNETGDQIHRIDITLFTKEGCSLCDAAVDVLRSVRTEYPHALHAIDITDVGQIFYWDRYKYDIPVFHIDGQYWAKHRLTADQARAALRSYRETGTMAGVVVGDEEPNAAAHERRRPRPPQQQQQ
jgi:hypothetical protein